MVVASIALFVSLGGTSIAAVNYASRAGSVDGKSAVYAGATLSQAAGKLVATNSSGADKGRLPGKFVADVGKTSMFSNIFEVADNAPGAPQTVSTLSGLGTLTATCNDQAAAAGNEDPISTITFNNASGEIVNVARRVGNGDGALTVAAEPDATSIASAARTRSRSTSSAARRTRSSPAACARTAAGRPRPPASSSASWTQILP